MVKIQNGSNLLLVTMGAFQNTYKKLGFTIVDEKKKYEEPVIKEVVAAPEAVEESLDYLLERPISSWSKEELRDFADVKKIDISGAQKVAEVKDIIKAWLEENA